MPYVSPPEPDSWNFTWDEFEQAFVDGRIDILQFVEVLNDNFGHIKAKAIVKKNLKMAFKQEGDRLARGELQLFLKKLGY